jgi:hypothetical protein
MLKLKQIFALFVFISLHFNLLSQKTGLSDFNEYWLISKDSLSIFRIDSSLQMTNLTNEIEAFTHSKFTCVLPLGRNKALIGTFDNYLWYYNNSKLEKFDGTQGITDKSIVSIAYFKKGRKIYIESDKNGFVSLNPTYKHFARFTHTYDENPVQDSIFRKFKHKNITRSLSHPLRNLMKNILPFIAQKEKEDRTGRKLSRRQINIIKSNLEPCDIILERKNGLITNKIIPKFWTHSAIYVGSLKTINFYFNGMDLLNGLSPARYIHKHYPKVYRKLQRMENPIIESVTKTGVSISPVRNVTDVDYFALLRTNLSKEDKFLTLLKAFEYYKQPYDFGFDLTDKDAVICSGLIYKSFIQSEVKQGITIPYDTLLGCPMMYPGDLVRKFDTEFDSGSSELQLILFFDSYPDLPRSYLKSAHKFRNSWKR